MFCFNYLGTIFTIEHYIVANKISFAICDTKFPEPTPMHIRTVKDDLVKSHGSTSAYLRFNIVSGAFTRQVFVNKISPVKCNLPCVGNGGTNDVAPRPKSRQFESQQKFA